MGHIWANKWDLDHFCLQWERSRRVCPVPKLSRDVKKVGPCVQGFGQTSQFTVTVHLPCHQIQLWTSSLLYLGCNKQSVHGSEAYLQNTFQVPVSRFLFISLLFVLPCQCIEAPSVQLQSTLIIALHLTNQPATCSASGVKFSSSFRISATWPRPFMILSWERTVEEACFLVVLQLTGITQKMLPT